MSTALNLPLIRLLVLKDWQLFQKQLAALVLAGFVAMALLGLATAWAFYLGSLLLIVVLVAAACFSISTSLLVERKEQTLAFVMSLPVSPLDLTLSKLAGNLITFGVPFLILLLGTVGVILTTPLPDGLLAMTVLLFGYVLTAYCVSLAVTMQVESEGWNLFAMIGSMVLINPFIMLLGQIDSIREPARQAAIVFSSDALALLGVQLVLSLTALGWIVWRNRHRAAFY